MLARTPSTPHLPAPAFGIMAQQALRARCRLTWRYVNMIRALTFVMLLALSTVARAEEWYPQWQPVFFPNREARVFIAEDLGPAANKGTVVWVYFVYEEPVPARFFRHELFIGEIQEWVVNCTNVTASIATIRYTNDPYPERVRRAAIVHPFGVEDPPSEEVARVCKLLT